MVTTGEGEVTGAGVLRGTRWMTLSTVSVQGMRMVISIVLARLLAPEHFGVVAMATVVLNFLDIFNSLGTGAAIVQRKELTQRLASTVFFFNLVIGAALTGLVVVAAPLVADLYRDDELTPILQVIALAVFLTAIGFVPQAMLRRHMHFSRLSAANIAQAIVYGLVAVILGAAGAGPWALVGGTLCGAATFSIATWSLSSWRPSWEFRRDDLKSISSYSLNLSASRVFGFVAVNIDKLIIGRALGATALGFYALAQRILLYPVQIISQALQEVLFPTFARVQDRDDQLREGYLRAIGGIAFITFPAMVGIAIVAGPLVDTLLGDEWRPAVTVIAILAPVGAVQAMSFTVTILYQAKARTDILFWWTIVSSIVGVCALLAGVPWGIEGVAAAYGIMLTTLSWPGFLIPLRLINTPFSALLATLRPYTFATVVMGVVALSVRLGLEAVDASSAVVLAVTSVCGAVVYALLSLRWKPDGLADLRRIVRPKANESA